MARKRTIAVVMLLLLDASSGRGAAEGPGLKDAAPPGMLIGVSFGRSQSDGQEPRVEAIVPRRFNRADTNIYADGLPAEKQRDLPSATAGSSACSSSTARASRD